jgi:hypothetical protein
MRPPSSEKVVHLVPDLGPGETGVLLLALECADPVVILDDAEAVAEQARAIAEAGAGAG